MGTHLYFCIQTKNINPTFEMINKVLLPLFALLVSTTNAAPSVLNNENVNKVITSNVPAQKSREELLYTVRCSGSCDEVKVEVNVDGDADIFVSRQYDLSWSLGRFNLAELFCESRNDGGYETCTSDIAENEFFVLIRAVKDHSEGNLSITGTNLISAEIQSESQPEPQPVEYEILTEYE